MVAKITLDRAGRVVIPKPLRTQGRGPARVFIDDSVLQLPVADVELDPPAGAQPSLTVVLTAFGPGANQR